MFSNVVSDRRSKVNAAHWLLVAGILFTCLNFVTSLDISQFYPYDLTERGDNQTEQKDDGGSPLLQLNVAFPFFHSNYSQIYVSFQNNM